MNKVLITDGLWRKSVIAIRALGKNHVNITVTGENIFTSGFFSKYCKKRVITPSAKQKPNLFAKKIINELKKEKYDLIIPMEDASIKALLPFRKQIEKLTFFPFPSTKFLKIAFDKQKTLDTANSIRIPIPKKYNNYSKLKITDLPLIIKPKEGSGSRGLQYIETKADLKRIKKLNLKNYIIQERIKHSGQEVGANLIFNKKHECVAGFTYKRIRDYPISGGPSTLRESTDNKQILNLSTKLLQSLNWVGVAMVEFKIDPKTNTPKLMEINPRFWGSLALPTASGINFPLLLLKIAKTDEIKPQFTYKIKQRARWLIPGDILHFLSNPNRFKMKPSFFNFFDQNTVYDDFDKSDPIGNIGVILCNLVNSFNPKMWKIAFRSNRR